MPQPFDWSTAHLALISTPTSSGEHKVLWALPDESEFEPIDGFKLADVPIGRLPIMYSEALNHSLITFMSNLEARANQPSETPSLHLDSKIKEYRHTAHFLISHLASTNCTYSEAVMALRFCQGALLELEARITWLKYVAPKFKQTEAWKSSPLCSVISAMSDKADAVKCCF
jgi:hypothetical protein